MPERPDLEYVVAVLQHEIVGLTLEGLTLRKPTVLRLAVRGDADRICAGRTIDSVLRHGHFVRFALTRAPEAGPSEQDPALEIVVSPMLAGLFDLCPAGQRVKADTAVIWPLSDGRQLRYLDTKQMGKVYVIPAGETGLVPGLDRRGLDLLDPALFTEAAFLRLARKRRDQVRVFLMDKGALDSLGNAYADEVLWEARIHPKAWVRKLSDDELGRLFRALPRVLGDAARIIRERRPPLATKVRDFVKVRNRAGQPCPRCGTKLRKAGVRGYDTHFCPECQPDRRKSSLVDWRKAR